MAAKEIAELKKIVNDAGLGIAGIESVNVSDDIKIGTAKRDEHIDNYIKTLQALGEADIHMVCYILCLYLTGRGQSLQGYGRTARRYWHIIRTP